VFTLSSRPLLFCQHAPAHTSFAVPTTPLLTHCSPGQAAVKELWTAFESCTRQVDHLRTSGFSASFIDSGACRTCLPAPAAAAAAAAAAGGEDPSSNSGRRGHSSAQQQQQQRVSFASEAGSTLAVAGSMAADPSSRGQGSFTSGNRSAAVAGSGGVAGGREQAVVVQLPISSSSAVTSPTHTSQAALLAAGGGSSRRYVNTHGAATMSSLTTTEGAPGGVLDVEKRHPGDSGDGVGDGKHPHKERRNGATYWTQVTTLIQVGGGDVEGAFAYRHHVLRLSPCSHTCK
jgi:hypothetical protein